MVLIVVVVVVVVLVGARSGACKSTPLSGACRYLRGGGGGGEASGSDVAGMSINCLYWKIRHDP